MRVCTFRQTAHYESLFMNTKVQLSTGMSRGTAFPTRLHVLPAKTKISLRIRAVWSVFAGHTVGSQSSKESWSGQRGLSSACVDVQANLSFRWSHMQSCRKCAPDQILPSRSHESLRCSRDQDICWRHRLLSWPYWLLRPEQYLVGFWCHRKYE